MLIKPKTLTKRGRLLSLAWLSLGSFLILSCTQSSASSPPVPASTLTEGDAFHSSFDTSALEGWVVSDREAPGPWQNCAWSAEQVSWKDGSLELGLEAKPHLKEAVSCGAVQRIGRYGHGIYEARLQSNVTSGMIAAFFTYIGPVHGEPHDEIDVELLGRHIGQVSPNSHVNGRDSKLKPANIGGSIREFHTYSFVWKPDSLSWYVDGRLVRETTDPRHLPTHTQKIVLSIWSTGTLTDWMGDFVMPESRHTMAVDWVAFTPLGAPCHYPDEVLGSVVCGPKE